MNNLRLRYAQTPVIHIGEGQQEQTQSFLQKKNYTPSGFVNTSTTTATNFVNFDLPSSVEIPVGETYFVGFGYYLAGESVFGAARDTNTNEGRSWAMGWNFDNPGGASDFSTATRKNNFDDVFGGNAMIRAVGDASPVPEPSSTALIGIGGLFLVLRRRV